MAWLRLSLLAFGIAALLPLAEIAHAQTSPAPADLLFREATRKYSAGEWRGAISSLEQFLGETPQHPQTADALFLLAESLAQAGEEAKSAEAMERFLRQSGKHPQTARAKLRLAELVMRRGETSRAKQLFQQAKGETSDPATASLALAYLALLELQVGNTAEAEPFLHQALARDARSPLASRCRLELAVVRAARVPHAATQSILRELSADSDPSIARGARFHSGLHHYQRGEWKLAQSAWDDLRTSLDDPHERKAIAYWRGLVHLQAGQAPLAIAALREVSESSVPHPLKRAASFHLAETYSRQGRHAEASKLLAEIAGEPGADEWSNAAAARMLEIAIREKDQKRIDSLAAQLAADDSSKARDRQTHRTLGRYYIDQENFAAAIAPLKSVVGSKSGESAPSKAKIRPAIFPAAALLAESPSLAKSPEVAAEDWYLLICAQIGANQPGEAIQSLDHAAKLSANTALQARLLLARGTAQRAKGDFAAAAATLESFAAKHPGDAELPRALLMLADAETRLKHWPNAEKALAMLRQKFAQSQERFSAVFTAAEAAAAEKEMEYARLWYQECQSAGGEIGDRAKLGLAHLSQKAAPAPVAARQARQLVEQLPAGDAALEATWNWGQQEERAGRVDAALAAYHRCIQAVPASPRRAEAMRAAARMHVRLEQQREAAELLERMIQEHPESSALDAAWMQLAEVRSLQGDRDASLAALRQISQSYPKSALLTSARHHLAVEAARDKHFAEARDWLRMLPPAQADDPQGADRLLLEAQVAAALQKWEEVDPPLAELESKYPKSPQVQSARFWRGEAAWRKGDGVAALAWFQPLANDEQSRTAPWRATAVLRTAQYQMKSEKWDEALALASRGAEESAEKLQKPEFEYLAGYALSRKGEWSAARQRLEQAARDPRCSPETSARSQWLIGECLAQEGRLEEGIQAWLRLETRTNLPSWQAAGVLRAAECRESRGEIEEARALYARVVRQYASTGPGEEASRRLLLLAPSGVAETGRDVIK